MELQDFIAATLRQILEGVRLAQSGQDGSNINADMAGAEFGGNLINVGTYGVATRVDFDVSVTAETSGKAGAKLAVFGVGVSGGADHKAGAANRICFSVPVRLPDGDTGRANRVREEGGRHTSDYSAFHSRPDIKPQQAYGDESAFGRFWQAWATATTSSSPGRSARRSESRRRGGRKTA